MNENFILFCISYCIVDVKNTEKPYETWFRQDKKENPV